MSDDRFDQELATRLRAYESRLPDAQAPTPGTGRTRRSGLPVLLVGGTAAVAAVVLAITVIQGARQNIGEPEPSPSGAFSTEPEPSRAPETSTTGAPSVGPSSPDATPLPPATDLAWSVSGSFESEGGLSLVQHVAAVDGGYVAVGIAYAEPLPNVGPTPPHALRVWLSADGRAWEVVELGPEFDNVQFTALVELADGSLLGLGHRSTIGEFGFVEMSEAAAWASPDGRTWTETASGLPSTPISVVVGGRGYLALVSPEGFMQEYELWHSADGMSWAHANTVAAGSIDIGAGDEGFVAVGRTPAPSDEPFAIASGDGREWFTASSPPADVSHVAALGGDWITMTAFSDDASTPPGATWVSANGLDWRPHGQAPLESVDLADDGSECREYPRDVLTAGPWLVASVDLSYPCSEGGFAVHGIQLISTDGATWSRLPMERGRPGQTRTGALVNAAIVAGETLILAGEEDGVATLWIGERP